MGQDVSIVVTGKDNFSSAITTMRNSGKHFNKDLDGLQKKLDELNKTKINLKVDVNKAKAELRNAEKQFEKTGDAADKLKLEMANQDYENANRNLRLVSSNARQAEKDILSLTNSSRKADNRASGGMSSSLSSLSKTMAASGASAFLGNAAGQVANAYVGSAYGSAAGNTFSSALSGAGMGAAIGTALGGPVGTAIGAALGGVVGVVQGAVQNFQEKDESFKSYYQDLYTTVTDEQKTMLSKGSEIAATRETQKMSFTTMLGSAAEADDFLGNIQQMEAKTPFEYDDLTSLSKSLLTYKYSTDEVLDTLNAVGEAGSALGMNKGEMSDVATYMGRMKLTGKTTMEYLNPLMEHGIDVYSALAKLPEVAGKTNMEIQDMVSKGLIPGEEAAEALADYMSETYSGSMELQSQTFSGLQSTLASAQNNLANAMGEGYNTMRKSGMQDEIDWLTGDSGTEMQEAYRQLGEAKGALENLQNQMVNEAMQSVMSGEITDSFANSNQIGRLKELAQEYKDAQAEIDAALESGDDTALEEAQLARGNALAEAKTIGYNEYNASEGAQAELDSMLSLAENIKNNAALNDNYYNAGYKMGQQFSKGLKSAVKENAADIINTPSSGGRSQGLTGDGGSGNGHPEAFGMSFVPYDNFPALLHHGERVMTASENRNYSEGGGAPVSFAGAAFYVREEADVDKIANRIVEKMIRAQELSI